jgi:hypothetical protein
MQCYLKGLFMKLRNHGGRALELRVTEYESISIGRSFLSGSEWDVPIVPVLPVTHSVFHEPLTELADGSVSVVVTHEGKPCFALVVLRARSDAVVLMFELAQSMHRLWLSHGLQEGALPLMLRTDDGANREIALPIPQDIANLCAHSVEADAVPIDTFEVALVRLMYALNGSARVREVKTGTRMDGVLRFVVLSPSVAHD